MRNVYKHLLIFCFAATTLHAKGQLVLNRHVTASSGGSGTIGPSILQYTIGEPLTNTLAGGSFMFTQGFLQPEEVPPLPPATNTVLDLIMFPNPALTTTKIQFDLLKSGSVTILLVNSAGQVTYQTLRECGAGKVQIILPVNHFAAGVYTVIVKTGGYRVQEKLVVQ
jgi:hypothetical protein